MTLKLDNIRALFDEIHIPVVVLDARKKICYANKISDDQFNIGRKTSFLRVLEQLSSKKDIYNIQDKIEKTIVNKQKSELLIQISNINYHVLIIYITQNGFGYGLIYFTPASIKIADKIFDNDTKSNENHLKKLQTSNSKQKHISKDEYLYKTILDQMPNSSIFVFNSDLEYCISMDKELWRKKIY